MNHPPIPFANPGENYRAHQEEIDSAIGRVLQGGIYILGPETREFEEEFARYLDVPFAIGVGNGTEALHLALKACDIGPGDEVITVSHTAVATVAAVGLCGAMPVLVDIDPTFYTIDPDQVKRAITKRTRAIIAVHLYGHPADMEPLLAISRANNLFMIEDCAQAHGAWYKTQRVGTWGDLAVFSFYPTKNLGALGDGGMVVTWNDQLAEKIRLLRQYGWKERFISSLPGWNSRLDELQAAILRIKLKYLDQENEQRRRLAAVYQRKLGSFPIHLPDERTACHHVYHLFVVQTPHRDALASYLNREGIGTAVHYPVPIHLQPGYQGYVKVPALLSETESIVWRIISLPLYPELAVSTIETIADLIHDFFKNLAVPPGE